jgi:hypothetical protein
MKFKDYIEKEELLACFCQNNVVEEGLIKNAMMAAPFMAAPFMADSPQKVEIPRAKQSQEIKFPKEINQIKDRISNKYSKNIDQSMNSKTNKIVNLIKKEWGVSINHNQVHWIKPIDVIKPMYGKSWDDVYKKTYDDQESISNPLETDLSLINVPIPVIIDDPRIYGSKNGTEGFCAEIGNQKICIVKNNQDILATLQHELTHAIQSNSLTSYGIRSYKGNFENKNYSDFINYLLEDEEIGARLANLKRQYYASTGKIVTKETIIDALKDVGANPKKYSDDVQQILTVFSKLKKYEKDYDKFFFYIKDNIDKVVFNQPVTNQSIT